ncbi:hypothetical protein FW774_10030 [Pedobacter sp. BS3]|uniref:hypothetical protein n=1 Tax=Pedobacter sp. BS3 TaxID=2567937 RepID=UPI0011ED8300|nr:hypothetical protein [Pedobacter sp. BS3]TZF83795.1 hypothetical protein FW774_10030 [Pedobacter sp. BS3]
MKSTISAIIIFCLYLLQAKGQDLVVASYNLRGHVATGIGNLWEDRKLLVVNLIEKYQFDIIGLQETEADMAGYLINTLPRFDSIGVFTKIPTGILYNKNRLTLQNSGHFWLSATPDTESKGWDAKFERICAILTLTGTARIIHC